MDVSGGDDFGGSVENVGSADVPASQIETENQPGDHVAEPSARASPPPSSEFVEVPGFGRVHKDDAPKAREFVKGAYGAFEAANLTQKQMRELQADPEAFLDKMGVDLDTIAGQRLARKLEAQLQTPEQRQMSEQERRFKEREDSLTKREKEIESQRLEEMTRHEVAQLDTAFQDALTTSGLPTTRQNLREMARVSRDYLARGIDIPAAHVASLVKDELGKHQDWRMQQVFDGSDEDVAQFMSGLGEKRAERVRQFFLKQVSSPTSNNKRSTTTGQKAAPRSNAKQPMTQAEWSKWVNT